MLYLRVFLSIFYLWTPLSLKHPPNQPTFVVVIWFLCGNSIWQGGEIDSPAAVLLGSRLSPERDFSVRFSPWSLRKSSPLQSHSRPLALLISQSLVIAWSPSQTWVIPPFFKSHQDEATQWKWRSWCLIPGVPAVQTNETAVTVRTDQHRRWPLRHCVLDYGLSHQEEEVLCNWLTGGMLR